MLNKSGSPQNWTTATSSRAELHLRLPDPFSSAKFLKDLANIRCRYTISLLLFFLCPNGMYTYRIGIDIPPRWTAFASWIAGAILNTSIETEQPFSSWSILSYSCCPEWTIKRQKRIERYFFTIFDCSALECKHSGEVCTVNTIKNRQQSCLSKIV